MQVSLGVASMVSAGRGNENLVVALKFRGCGVFNMNWSPSQELSELTSSG